MSFHEFGKDFYRSKEWTDLAESLRKNKITYQQVKQVLDVPAREGYWTSKDGRTQAISQMDTKHIENCIRVLEKRVAVLDPAKRPYRECNDKIQEFKAELLKRNPPPEEFSLRGAL